jgi:RNA polymerase sigma-70 factor
VITGVFDEAVAQHGALGLNRQTYAQLLITKIRRQQGAVADSLLPDLVLQLHTTDLYLAGSCGIGDERAWCRFGDVYGRYIRYVVQRRTRANEPARELCDSILVELFMPDRSGLSRITSYDGRSSLAQWLRVIVAHRVANERARKANRMEYLDVDEMRDDAALASVETTEQSQDFTDAVNSALADACRQLTRTERLILLWRYEDSLRLGEIASLLGVHISTVTRQIDRLCLKLRRHVMHVLMSRNRLTEPTVHECFADVLDNRTEAVSLLSVLRALTVERPPERGCR